MINQYTQQYPLTEEWAKFTLGLKSIIIFIAFQWFLTFLWRFLFLRDKQNESTLRRNLAWAILLLGFGAAFLIFVHSDYYLSDIEREQFNLWGYLSISLGALCFFIISETIKQDKNHKFSITASFLVIFSIVSIIFQFFEALLVVGTIGGFITILYILQYRKILITITIEPPMPKGMGFEG